MRIIVLVATLALGTSSAIAETWLVREGGCGEWQSRWEVEQEQRGVWLGTIQHVHIGGPCVQGSRATLTSEVRAMIAGENLFALRTTEDGKICTYVARIVRENRGRGVALCEGYPQRIGFVIRFRAQEARPMPELPPDDDLLTEEQRRRPDLRFEFRGFEELFGR